MDTSLVVLPFCWLGSFASKLTTVTALDFLHNELQDSEESMLVTVQRELAKRTYDSLEGDEAATAKKLGITKPALKKLLG